MWSVEWKSYLFQIIWMLFFHVIALKKNFGLHFYMATSNIAVQSLSLLNL
jgi:hypothetical protein